MEKYTEAYRYLDNAKEILRTKAIKEDGFYNDMKYVKMACNSAYSGLLVALNDYFTKKGVEYPKPKGKRTQSTNVDFYKKNLALINKKKLKEFNSAYNYLHLLGGYDGDLDVNTSATGFKHAKSIIDWVANQMLVNQNKN